MKKNIAALLAFIFLFAFLKLDSLAQLPNTWTQKSDFGGSARYGAVSFSIGSKGYLGTGFANGRQKDFWEYDPISDSWSQKADFGGTARFFAAGFSIGMKGYLGTGNDGIQRNDFWEYDPVTNIWTEKANFGGIPRDAAVGLCIGSKGYIGTGELADAFDTKLNDFWEYDPTTNSWSQKSNVGNVGRSWAVAFSIGNRGYIGTGATSVLSKDFLEYNPDTDTWTTRASFVGLGRFGAVGMGIGSKGYIGTGDVGGGYTNDFWEYNQLLDTWTQKNSFGGALRTTAIGFSIENKAYIGTGNNGLIGIKYKDFWEYTATCILPSIAAEPGNQTITYGSPATFTVVATDAVYYQWQEDAGSGFVNIAEGGIYSNVTTATLTISSPTVVMSGYKYRCVITDNCSQQVLTNGNATLSVSLRWLSW